MKKSEKAAGFYRLYAASLCLKSRLGTDKENRKTTGSPVNCFQPNCFIGAGYTSTIRILGWIKISGCICVSRYRYWSADLLIYNPWHLFYPLIVILSSYNFSFFTTLNHGWFKVFLDCDQQSENKSQWLVNQSKCTSWRPKNKKRLVRTISNVYVAEPSTNRCLYTTFTRDNLHIIIV